MHEESELYRQVNAVNSKDFNSCFYCGCISSKYDLSPPLKYAEFYLKTRVEADFYKVPCCSECFSFLSNDKSSLLEQRIDNVKLHIAKKYKKAIRVYEMWDHNELEELDYKLKHSIKAGLKLGKESYERYKFKGFEFEVDGEKHSAYFFNNGGFTIFGERYDNFKDALDYGSKAFRIPKAKLLDLYLEYNNDFDIAIRSFQDEIDQNIYLKELSNKCKSFASEHKQNVKFVMHTVEMYRKQDDTLTIDLALIKLLDERISKLKLIKGGQV